MSQDSTKQAVQTAPEDAPVPDTPTITRYQQLAANLSKAIDEMLTAMPNFVPLHPSTKGFVRAQKSVSDDFLISVIAAVEGNPDLQALNQFNVAEARDALQFKEAFRPMADKLHAAAKDVDFSIDLRRANVVAPALQMYDLTKGLARNPSGTLAAAHAGNLKRDLGRAGRRKKKQVPQPTPVPPVAA
jgi:hypothetical protein